VEFTNEVRVNHLGVRDDEASLVAPDVIVIGDSHAMGWGVDQGARCARARAKERAQGSECRGLIVRHSA